MVFVFLKETLVVDKVYPGVIFVMHVKQVLIGSMDPTVDGSEIPNNYLTWIRNPTNHGTYLPAINR